MDFCSGNVVVNLLLALIGLAFLIKGSDWFVEGAAGVARRYRISEAVIGLTLVSLGTSLPEFATNVYASGTGQGDISLGNIVGSNISNTLLIMGAGAVLSARIAIARETMWRDAGSMLGVTLLCYLFCAMGHEVERWEGLILLAAMIGYSICLCRNRSALEEEAGDVSVAKFATAGTAIGFAALGLVLLVAGAKMMVDNVVWFSLRLHLNQAVIGTTVVALGTSLPELAVTVMGVIKKKHAMAVGNVIGSNFYNIGLILGTSALIAPVPVAPMMQYFNLPVMMLSAVMLLIFMYTGRRLVRREGIALLAGYAVFIAWNVWNIKS